MKKLPGLVMLTIFILSMSSCVSKKKFVDKENELSNLRMELDNKRKELADCNEIVKSSKKTINAVNEEYNKTKTEVKIRQEQIEDYKSQIADLRKQRDMQMTTVGDLTVLSQEANQNIGKTIEQLKEKDRYINLIQSARTKADSMNLALAINLKGALAEGLSDNDINIKVDKTVVYVDMSDKMLYRSGSSDVTTSAKVVLGKIAKILQANPQLDVMVEGHTDNKSINTSCVQDNWDLSVKRATSVVRVLEDDYGIASTRLIASGRGETTPIADNSTDSGRSSNRRTRLILLPKINQFYDLLKPTN